MGLLTKLGKTVIKAADKAKDINKQMSLDLPDVVKDTPIKMPTIIDDLTDEATEMLGNKEAIDNWKKENKVPKKESKRRKQRKFSEQAQDLQAGIMSGPEYRKYIRENQPATSFTPEDLKTMMPNFKQVVGALTKDKSDSGILGLNSSLEKGNVVSSRLDIPAYNEHDIWVTSIVDKEKGKLYGRTAVLKNVNFDMTNKGAKKLALDIATEAKKTKKVLDKETGERVPQEFTQTKTPFATMKGEWQDFSDKDAFALAEKYINDPEWIQVGFNPERHSFFYDKETMMPVFNADAVVQIGALVLAKVPKLSTSALKAERINKLRKLRIDNMPEGAKPATFKEGGLVPMENQMNFALGGLNDEGGEIDEASGNRVPIGGTKEGVRDDIPANVSEGEFIFPADVVRYHGLDKMMALRQEAKMGLRKMESMGQMGNSEEASMPDDLPFEMADLIVVGGQGEPMEFAEGGFVPQMQTLQTAPVPTMGGGTTGGTTTTPIVYDDFMKTPVVTMQEYRDANGNSIIITSVNGKATTAVPDGYTLYTPPANTAPTTTQAAIQTVNRRSYSSTQDGGEGPEPQPDQPAPDYGSMDDNDYFNAMAEQNSFGAKAGNAAAMTISLMLGGPVALGVSLLMRNNKNNQIASMEARIANMSGSAKVNAQNILNEYRGETDPEKKQGLFSRITDFVGGIATNVAGVLGISQEDAAKVTQQAAGSEVSGAVIGDGRTSPLDGRTQSVTPTADQTRPQLRPNYTGPSPSAPFDTKTFGGVGPVTNLGSPIPGEKYLTNYITSDGYNPTSSLGLDPAPMPQQAGPTALPMNTFDDVPFGIKPDIRLAQLAGIAPTSDSTRDILNRRLETGRIAERLMPPPPVTETQRAIPTGRDINMEVPAYDAPGSIGYKSPQLIDAPSIKPLPIEPLAQAGALDDMTARAPVRTSVFETSKPAVRTAGLVGDTIGAINKFGAENLGGIDPSQSEDALIDQVRQGVTTVTPSITQAPVAPSQPSLAPMATPTSEGTRQRAVGEDFDAVAANLVDPRVGDPALTNPSLGNLQPSNVMPRTALETNLQQNFVGAGDPTLTQTQQAFGGSTYDEVPSGYRGPNVTAAPSLDTMDALGGIDESYRTSYGIGKDLSKIPDMIGAVSGAAQPAAMSTAQRRAREAAAQRARIQTRNKEIASATALIPAYIANSKQTQDAIKAGYAGSTTGGYAIGKISGSDGNNAGVVQRADGKVTKVRDLDSGATGQRAGMTVFSDAEGTRYTKSTFGKKTKLNGDKYEGPGITQQDKGGTPATATAKQVTKEGVRYNTSDGSGGTPSKPADPPGNTGGFTGIRDMFDGGGPGESGKEEVERGGGDGGSSRVICTELYKQGKLDRELYRMDVVYTAKHLSPITVRGYHYWAVPMVVKMRSSTLLTNVFEYLTIARAKEIAHIVKPQEYKDRSVLGYIIKNVGEAICYSIGLFTDQKDWTVLYNKGAVK